MKIINAKKNSPMIAEFMGYKLITPEMRRDPSTWKYSYWENHNDDAQIKVLCGEDSLSYHYSYNDLMKAVDKIENLDSIIQTSIRKDTSGEHTFGIIWYGHYIPKEKWYPTKFEAVYYGVIDFIHYYNTNIKDAKI